MSGQIPEYNLDVVKKYLLDRNPEGPWCLASLYTKSKEEIFEVKTCDTINECLQFVELHNGATRHQVYYLIHIADQRHIGPNGSEHPPLKSHMRIGICFHIDIDPAADPKDAEEAAADTDAILTALCTEFPLPPTIAIATGRGGQGEWWLVLECRTELISEDVIAEFESYSRGIREWFSKLGAKQKRPWKADGCFRVNQFFRLPGTVNWPSAERRQRYGAQPKQARLVEYDLSRRYTFDDFKFCKMTPLKSADPEKIPNDFEIDFDAAAAMTEADFDQIEGLSPTAMSYLVAGHEGRDPNRVPNDGSDSTPSHFVTMELLRTKLGWLPKRRPPNPAVSHTHMFAALHNECFWTSQHTHRHYRYWKHKTPAAYAINQIRRAYKKYYDLLATWESENPELAVRFQRERDAMMATTDKGEKPIVDDELHSERWDPPENPVSEPYTLDWMNERHAVLVDPNPVVVVHWRRSEIDNSWEITTKSFKDIEQLYRNRKVVVGYDPNHKPIKKPLGKAWLDWDGRREYKDVRFLPGKAPVVDGYYNRYTGFALQPKPGDWSMLHDHIRDVICAGDEKNFEYTKKYFAFLFQHPERIAETCIAVRGIDGAGKGLLGRIVAEIFGQPGLQIAAGRHLQRFNASLQYRLFVFIDEAIAPGDDVALANAKFMITEHVLDVEGKHRDSKQIPNHLSMYMVSNNQKIVALSHTDRRFVVFEASPHRAGDKEYFTALNVEQYDRGGREAFLYDMLNMPLGNWHPRDDPPRTAAFEDQVELNLPPMDQFFLYVADGGDITSAPATAYGKNAFWASDGKPNQGEIGLYSFIRRSVPALKNASDTLLGRELTKFGIVNQHTRGGNVRIFPPRQEMRDWWDRERRPRQWPPLVEWNGEGLETAENPM